MGPKVDPVTVVGLGLLLMPLLAMAHEIGGHAAMCSMLGGHVLEIGAFYIHCDFESGSLARKLVAMAGPTISGLLSLAAWLAWRRARGNLSRLFWWYLWISAGFSCAGYFAFSGALGIGDLSPEAKGGIGPLPSPGVWRIVLIVIGVAAYVWLIKAGKRSLSAMVGSGPATVSARRTVAHLYYGVVGLAAVLASLPNPMGMAITLASAAAANFGGNAGFISLGFERGGADAPHCFIIKRSWPILVVGLLVSLAFAVALGPSLKFGG